MALTSMSFFNCGDNMEVRCFDEDSEMPIILTSKENHSKVIYSLSIKEATDLRNFIDEHLKLVE